MKKLILILLFPFMLNAQDIYFEGGEMSLQDLANIVSIETKKNIILYSTLHDTYVFLTVGAFVKTTKLMDYFQHLLEANDLFLVKRDEFYVVTPKIDLKYFEHKFKHKKLESFEIHLETLKDYCTLSKSFLFCYAPPKEIDRIKKTVTTFDVEDYVNPYMYKNIDISFKILETSYGDLLKLKSSLSSKLENNNIQALGSASDSVSIALSLLLGGSQKVIDSLKLSYIFDFLQKNNISRVLNEPRILVTNNQTTSIVTGGSQRVIKSRSENDNLEKQKTTYEEFTTGLQLSVKAKILDDLRCLLNISLKNEDVIGGSSELPVTSKQSYNTTIALEQNKTIVIGGVVYDKKTKEHYKIPILGDIPILGIPFRSTSENEEQKVLTIAITLKGWT